MTDMEIIKNKEYGGERPLFGMRNLYMENVIVHAGESALKRCMDVKAFHCRFEGKYPFWHCKDLVIEECSFPEAGRAAIWYSQNCVMRHCLVDAPKMFRMMHGVDVSDCDFPNGEEMLWDCDGVRLQRVQVANADYIFMHTDNIVIDHYEQDGNYSFQYSHNALISNAKIDSKDAFWNTHNFTIIDSEINGEYLGWYSEGLTLINCHISGTQPLCYCQNLTMINCTMAEDCDRAFEESEVTADIASPITSITNPRSGIIRAKSVGEIILDKNLTIGENGCKIITME